MATIEIQDSGYSIDEETELYVNLWIDVDGVDECLEYIYHIYQDDYDSASFSHLASEIHASHGKKIDEYVLSHAKKARSTSEVISGNIEL